MKENALKEAKILEFLDHPNIMKCKEVYQTKKEKLCIIMEYCEGSWEGFKTT